MPKRKPKDKRETNSLPGIPLEKAVARIQQMMDPNSKVTHNERIVDRLGMKRQCDVVIRGQSGGRDILGIIECKDHSRKKGPHDIEAFAKKTENLNANIKLMVSRKGFTAGALKLARHEGIGCLSILPIDQKMDGFSIGNMSYGKIYIWNDFHVEVEFAEGQKPVDSYPGEKVNWKGKRVLDAFLNELFTKHGNETTVGQYSWPVKFDRVRDLEINGETVRAAGINFFAKRICRNKKKWVNWSGDAFYDWQAGQIRVPAMGTITGSAMETDLFAWDDYDGEIPSAESLQPGITLVLTSFQTWNTPEEVLDLSDI